MYEHHSGVMVTLNRERHRDMIENFLEPQLHAFEVINIWHQQDGLFKFRITMEVLRDFFQ